MQEDPAVKHFIWLEDLRAVESWNSEAIINSSFKKDVKHWVQAQFASGAVCGHFREPRLPALLPCLWTPHSLCRPLVPESWHSKLAEWNYTKYHLQAVGARVSLRAGVGRCPHQEGAVSMHGFQDLLASRVLCLRAGPAVILWIYLHQLQGTCKGLKSWNFPVVSFWGIDRTSVGKNRDQHFICKGPHRVCWGHYQPQLPDSGHACVPNKTGFYRHWNVNLITFTWWNILLTLCSPFINSKTTQEPCQNKP